MAVKSKPRTESEKSDTFQTRGYDRLGAYDTEATANDLLEIKRGMAWLNREIPALQDFARAWTGQNNIVVQIGPVTCTDGKIIYLTPPRLAEGEAEPTREYMARLYHEVAHCCISDVYEPPNAPRTVKNSVKYQADKEFGSPAGWIWNALEDGRVEEWLYTEAPGARKHIRRLLKSIQDDTIKSLHNPEPPRTPEQALDIGLMLGAYYKSAGHEDIVELFPQKVLDALSDPEIDGLIKRTHTMKSSIQVVRELVQPFMRRARELGFFADADPRSLNPETGQPENVDWDDLTEEEKEQIRQDLRDQLRNPQKDQPKGGKGVELPDEEIQKALDELTEEEKQKLQEEQQGNEDGQPSEGKNQSGTGSESDDADEEGEGAGSEQGDESDEQSEDEGEGEGAGSEKGESEEQSESEGSGTGAQGLTDDEARSDTAPQTHAEGDSGSTGDTDGAPESVSGPSSPDSEDGQDAEIEVGEQLEADAKAEHERREKERLDRWEQFTRDFDAIEDTMRPPHQEIKAKGELTYDEKNSTEAKQIEKAEKLEVGHIWGSERHDFVYAENKIRGKGNSAGRTQLNGYSDVIGGNLNRLRALFKQNKKSSFAGRFEMGQHVNQRSLVGLMMKEHFKPFDRRIKPKKYDYAVTLLIDQSGSMGAGYGVSKIEMARLAVAMQAEMLSKLQIPFEVLGFTTGHTADTQVMHSVFKGFDETWNTEVINRVLDIQSQNSNLDGLALAWAWERLKVRKEKVKILVSYSDGQPSPDTDNQTRIMKHVLRKVMQAGAVAVGVGIQSNSVDRLYPKVVHCNDVRDLPKQMIEMLEAELRNK